MEGKKPKTLSLTRGKRGDPVENLLTELWGGSQWFRKPGQKALRVPTTTPRSFGNKGRDAT